jgi:hypothetical protein
VAGTPSGFCAPEATKLEKACHTSSYIYLPVLGTVYIIQYSRLYDQDEKRRPVEDNNHDDGGKRRRQDRVVVVQYQRLHWILYRASVNKIRVLTTTYYTPLHA